MFIDNIYYYAYGSNLLIDRLERRVGIVEKVRPLIFRDFSLKFNCGYQYNYCFANIVPQRGEQVEGVLYRMSAKQQRDLDFHEALYDKKFFNIGNGEIGYVYVGSENRVLPREGIPELHYLNLLIDGCLENNFTDTFRKLVAFKLANYNLKRSKHKL